MKVGEILQHIYDSEINIEISWFWDGGINWKIGDESNGFKASNFRDIYDIDTATKDLCDKIIKIYPNSEFTKWYNNPAQQ